MVTKIYHLKYLGYTATEASKIPELVTKADRNGFRRNLTLDLPITDANAAAVNLHKEPKKKNQSVKENDLTMSYQQVIS